MSNMYSNTNKLNMPQATWTTCVIVYTTIATQGMMNHLEIEAHWSSPRLCEKNSKSMLPKSKLFFYALESWLSWIYRDDRHPCSHNKRQTDCLALLRAADGAFKEANLWRRNAQIEAFRKITLQIAIEVIMAYPDSARAVIYTSLSKHLGVYWVFMHQWCVGDVNEWAWTLSIVELLWVQGMYWETGHVL